MPRPRCGGAGGVLALGLCACCPGACAPGFLGALAVGLLVLVGVVVLAKNSLSLQRFFCVASLGLLSAGWLLPSCSPWVLGGSGGFSGGAALAGRRFRGCACLRPACLWRLRSCARASWRAVCWLARAGWVVVLVKPCRFVRVLRGLAGIVCDPCWALPPFCAPSVLSG